MDPPPVPDSVPAAAEPEAAYAAFISYSHRSDHDFAADLQRDLESFLGRWMKRRHLRVWRDQDSLPAQSDLPAEIERNLLRSSFLVVLASPESAASQWVPREVELFVRARGRARACIVLTRGNLPWGPPPLVPLGGELCAIAAPVYGALCQPGAEKLVIDLRPFRGLTASERRKSTAYLRWIAAIVAAIKNTDADLVYGEHLKVRRREAWIAIAAAIGALALAAVAGWSYRAEGRARDAEAAAALDLRGRFAQEMAGHPQTLYDALAEGVLAAAPDVEAGRRPQGVRLGGLGRALSALSTARLLHGELPGDGDVYFSPDQTAALAIASPDGPILRWDLDDGDESRVAFATPCPTTWADLALSPDGRYVGRRCRDSSRLELIDASDGTATSLPPSRWREIDEPIEFSEDGAFLAFTEHQDQLEHAYDVEARAEAAAPDSRAADGFGTLALDRRRVIPHGRFFRWNLATKEALLGDRKNLQNLSVVAAYSRNGMWRAVQENDEIVVTGFGSLWWLVATRWRGRAKVRETAVHLSFSRNGHYLIATLADGSLATFDLRRKSAAPPLKDYDVRQPAIPMQSAVISDDGTRVIGIARNRSVWSWTAGRTGSSIVTLALPDAAPDVTDGDSLVSPDGRRAIVLDGKLTLWDRERGRAFPSLDAGLQLISWPTHRLVAIAGSAGAETWIVLDTETGARIGGFSAGTNPGGTAWSRDGQHAAVPDGRTVRIVDRDGKDEDRLIGHAGTVTRVGYSNDGALIATAADDDSLLLWDAATREPLAAFNTPAASLRFSADDTRLVIDDALVVALEPRKWLAAACELLRTRPQWSRVQGACSRAATAR